MLASLRRFDQDEIAQEKYLEGCICKFIQTRVEEKRSFIPK